MEKVQSGHRLSLCWGCKNTSRDKCSWFDPPDPQPVPGWVAERHVRSRIGETYTVLECPNFDPEPPREAPPAPIPPEPVVHGVCRNGKGWAARITKKGKYYHLGSFKTEEEAIAARRAAEEAIARGEEPQCKRRERKAPKPKKQDVPGVRRGAYGWQARITKKDKHYYLGSFKTEEEAIAARRAAEEAIARGEEPQLKRAPPKEPKPKELKPKKVRPAGYCPGVYFHRGYWEARIKYQGRAIYLGCFKGEEDAVAARKAAEKAIKRGKAPRPLNRR